MSATISRCRAPSIFGVALPRTVEHDSDDARGAPSGRGQRLRAPPALPGRRRRRAARRGGWPQVSTQPRCGLVGGNGRRNAATDSVWRACHAMTSTGPRARFWANPQARSMPTAGAGRNPLRWCGLNRIRRPSTPVRGVATCNANAGEFKRFSRRSGRLAERNRRCTLPQLGRELDRREHAPRMQVGAGRRRRPSRWPAQPRRRRTSCSC